ncbi:probable polygalacturonase At3g15720 [Impatiens glandulifera]|uniref:probable polygalacturonase At3g15720 n=1 Tax=Impatiens glandulifera TaxID=253017 RepID=UPI001FB09A3B|nr:probable polygalacturonase At3g15720 [Impatiens glandulifera]
MSQTVLNVMNYGAVGNGKTDDSQAFLKAWKAACQTTPLAPTVLIPARTFLLKPLTFSGPCKSSRIYFQIMGKIVAPNSKNGWLGRPTNTWVVFYGVNGLSVSGPGQFDGQGSIWWSNPCMPNSAQNAANCKAPTAVTYKRCNNLQISGLTHINPMKNHIQLTTCNGVTISNLRINAPETSPNTDGIDIASSTAVKIRNSVITTGDDCIAISGGSSNIDISGIFCGPGHGISIGALGHGGYDIVENVNVRNCTFKGTLTGVRIKTWQGGSGYARKISFNKINFIAVYNPIIIDQFYCPTRTSTVKVSDVSFTSIVGTSNMDQAINLSCSQSVGCTNIVLDRVYISHTTKGRKIYATCNNAHGKATHTKPAVKCLLP